MYSKVHACIGDQWWILFNDVQVLFKHNIYVAKVPQPLYIEVVIYYMLNIPRLER